MGNGVFLSRHPEAGSTFESIGSVLFIGARISGVLDCAGGIFNNPNGIAMAFDRAVVTNSVFLSDGFHATGEVRGLGAQVRNQLTCSGGRFINPNGDAISMDASEMGSFIMLAEAGGSPQSVEGRARFVGIRVRQHMHFGGGQFRVPTGRSINVDSATIDGSLYFSDGISVTGCVALCAARIQDQLALSNVKLSNERDIVLNLERTQADSLWIRGTETQISGQIIIASARFRVLNDNFRLLANNDTSFYLDGFVYERIGPGSPTELGVRLNWLDSQIPTFRPQPFDQLANVYTEMGWNAGAKSVLIHKRRRQRNLFRNGGSEDANVIETRNIGAMTIRWVALIWDLFVDWSVCYGWEPWRPVVFSFIYAIAGSTLVAIALARLADPEIEVVNGIFAAIGFSIDTLLPGIELGAEPICDAANESCGRWSGVIRVFHWSLEIMGWIATMLFVASVTGIVKK